MTDRKCSNDSNQDEVFRRRQQMMAQPFIDVHGLWHHGYPWWDPVADLAILIDGAPRFVGL